MIGALPVKLIVAELAGTVGVWFVETAFSLEVWNQDGKEMTLSALIAWNRTNES
jgi:hypothetical protein